MQIAKINSVNLNTYKQQNIKKQNTQPISQPMNNNAEDLSFEGLNQRFNRCGKFFLNTMDLEAENFFFNDIYHFLSIAKEDLVPYFRLDRKDRTDFFYDLADNLSKDFFKQKRRLEPKESLQLLDGIYQAVKNPTRTHETIVKHPDFTFEQKQQLLLLTAEAGPKAELYNKLRHTQDLGRSTSSINWSGEEYLSLLTSPNAEKLNKNFQTFREYIRLNHTKPDFIEGLNRELAQETPSFDPNRLLRQTIITDYSTSAPILRALPQEELLRNWNPEGMELMDFRYTHSFHVSYRGDNYSEENINFYRYLFNTTNKDNLEFRKAFFESTYTKPKNQDTNSTIATFLERVETDDEFRTIYETAVARNSGLAHRSFNEMLYYADSFGSDVLVKKLDKFFEIIDTTSAEPEEMVQILRKNLNNKYYLSDSSLHNLRDDEVDIRRTSSFFPETRAQIHRLKRKFTYTFLPKIFGTGQETALKAEMKYSDYSSAIANSPLKGFVNRGYEVAEQRALTSAPEFKAIDVSDAEIANARALEVIEEETPPVQNTENVREVITSVTEEEKTPTASVREVIASTAGEEKIANLPIPQQITLPSLAEILRRTSSPSPIIDMSKFTLPPIKKPERKPITDPGRLLGFTPVQIEEKAKPSQILEIIASLENSAKAKEAAKPVIKRDYKAEYRARKLKIQGDAKEIIKSRMKSAKQIQEQIGDYTQNATKMRNQFLNEMFNSVAETRAQQRARGIKHPNISNADVIKAYKQINGSNKKLFRAMLKARTETGERKYNLKEITKILEQMNKERKAAQKAAAAQRRLERKQAKLNATV